GELRARQFGDCRTRGRARAGNQKRRGIAVAGNVGHRRLTLLSGGRGDQRTIGRGEQAGRRLRYHKRKTGDLPVVVHAQNRRADSGLVGNLHVDLSRRDVVDGGADAVDGGGNSGSADGQRQHAGRGGGGRQLRAEYRHQRTGRECLGVGRSVGDGRDRGGLRSAHHEGHGDVDGLRNGIGRLHRDDARVGPPREAGPVDGDVQGSRPGSGKRAHGEPVGAGHYRRGPLRRSPAESERHIGGRAVRRIGDGQRDGLWRHRHAHRRGGGCRQSHAERGGHAGADFANAADGVSLGSQGGGAAQADIALQRSIGGQVGGAEDLLKRWAQIRAAPAEGGDLHQEAAGFLQNEAVGKLARLVGVRVLYYGGRHTAQRHAGGGSAINGILERHGDIARPRSAVQVLAFEMEDAVERNGEVVAGKRDLQDALGGDDDGARAENSQVVDPVDGEGGERGLHVAHFGEHQDVRPVALRCLLVDRIGSDKRNHQGSGGGTNDAHADGAGGGVVRFVAVIDGGDDAIDADRRSGRRGESGRRGGAVSRQIGGPDGGVDRIVMHQEGDCSRGRGAGRAGGAAAHGSGEVHGIAQCRSGRIGGDSGSAGGAVIPLGDQVIGVDGAQAAGQVVSRTGSVTDEALHAIRRAEGAAH